MDGTELTQELIKGKLSRRDFLSLGGVALFANIVADPIANITKATVTKVTNDIISDKSDLEISLAKNVFGDFQDNFSFTPGTAHYLYHGAMHPDDVQAAKTLEDVGLDGIDKVKIVPDFFPLEDLKGNFVSLGSPNSNFLTRQVLGYSYKSNDCSEGFKRDKNAIIELPFEYALEAASLLGQGAVFKRYIRDQLLEGPNWGIRDNTLDRLLVPATAQDKRLVEDYLLITVLPNYLTKATYENENRIIIFGGAHGAGTKAISLLFRNRPILREIKKKVSVSPYWQALLRISRVVHTNSKSQEPIRIESDLRVEPIHINLNKVEKLFLKTRMD